MVVEALQLVLAVVDTVECRRQHDEQREDNAEDQIVTGLGQLVHLLHDCPADIKHCQVHFVHRVWLPYHTAHYTTAAVASAFNTVPSSQLIASLAECSVQKPPS